MGKHKKNNHIKMAFYIYEQPDFSMEHFHPGFFQSLRSISRPRHWNLLEKFFDEEETGCQSNQTYCSSKSVEKTNQENKSMEPVTKSVSKRFMSKVSCQETIDK